MGGIVPNGVEEDKSSSNAKEANIRQYIGIK